MKRDWKISCRSSGEAWISICEKWQPVKGCDLGQQLNYSCIAERGIGLLEEHPLSAEEREREVGEGKTVKENEYFRAMMDGTQGGIANHYATT